MTVGLFIPAEDNDMVSGVGDALGETNALRCDALMGCRRLRDPAYPYSPKGSLLSAKAGCNESVKHAVSKRGTEGGCHERTEHGRRGFVRRS